MMQILIKYVFLINIWALVVVRSVIRLYYFIGSITKKILIKEKADNYYPGLS
jgi:hypothetical protein